MVDVVEVLLFLFVSGLVVGVVRVVVEVARAGSYWLSPIYCGPVCSNLGTIGPFWSVLIVQSGSGPLRE